MKFNLDIVEAYIDAFGPVHMCKQSSKLHLLNITMKIPSPENAASMLCILDASSISAEMSSQLENTYLVVTNVLSKEEKDRVAHCLPHTCSALFLTKPCSEINVCECALRMMQEINEWSEELLLHLTQNAPLRDVCVHAQRIFSNPLMVSDSGMCYSLIAGPLPADFEDELWTPAIKTGFCPLENYYTQWHDAAEDPFGTNKAFIVGPSATNKRSYLYRNIAHESHYYGSFELIDIHKPFTRADISFADYLGDVLTAVLSSHVYENVTESSANPLQDVMHNRPVRKELIDFVLKRLGWDANEEYHVTYFQPVGALKNQPTALMQCRKRIEAAYPAALIFMEDDGLCAIKRQKDFPLESALCTSDAVSKLFAPPYEIAMGASSTMTDFMRLPTALKQARFALSYAKEEMKNTSTDVAHLVRFDDCYFDAFVQSFNQHDFSVILSVSPVETLIASDEENQTEYINTLISFFENGFNIHHTAEALHVHRNTLSYRLKRIKRLSGIDCETPANSTVDPLRVYVACRAYTARQSHIHPFDEELLSPTD